MSSDDQAPKRHSDRARPAAFWALVELNQLATAWLEAGDTRGPQREQIFRNLLRAATALSHAAAGRRVRSQLSSVVDALRKCEEAFLGLAHLLPADVVHAAICRIDRIVASVEELRGLEVERWPEAALPPMRAIAQRLAGRLLH